MAFRCFFSLLFSGKLPGGAGGYLQEIQKVLPEPAAQPESPKESKPVTRQQSVSGGSAKEREGALTVLGLLQREGRLVDFLNETIESYDDSDIGAAVRDIHRGCQKVLTEHFTLEPVMPGEEDESVNVPKGFDPGEIRLVGEAPGEPPFQGVLRHHGWRVTNAKLPAVSEGVDRNVLAPAEVELN